MGFGRVMLEGCWVTEGTTESGLRGDCECSDLAEIS